MLETGLKALQMQRYEKLFRKPPLIGTDKYIKKIKAGQTGLSCCIRGSWSSALPVMASGHGGMVAVKAQVQNRKRYLLVSQRYWISQP